MVCELASLFKVARSSRFGNRTDMPWTQRDLPSDRWPLVRGWH
jgi:hypothetical protein